MLCRVCRFSVLSLCVLLGLVFRCLVGVFSGRCLLGVVCGGVILVGVGVVVWWVVLLVFFSNVSVLCSVMVWVFLLSFV